MAPLREKQVFASVGARGTDRKGRNAAGAEEADQEKAREFLLIAMIFSVPYLSVKAFEGVRLGRRFEVQNRVALYREQEWARQDAAARENPIVRAALRAIAHVKRIVHQQAMLSERIAHIAAPWETRITALASQCLSPRERHDEETLRRIEDRLDDLAGAQGKWDRMLEEVLVLCEPVGSRWSQAARSLRGYEPPRARTREEKRGL